jgi:hypothetical protein
LTHPEPSIVVLTICWKPTSRVVLDFLIRGRVVFEAMVDPRAMEIWWSRRFISGRDGLICRVVGMVVIGIASYYLSFKGLRRGQSAADTV